MRRLRKAMRGPLCSAAASRSCPRRPGLRPGGVVVVGSSSSWSRSRSESESSTGESGGLAGWYAGEGGIPHQGAAGDKRNRVNGVYSSRFVVSWLEVLECVRWIPSSSAPAGPTLHLPSCFGREQQGMNGYFRTKGADRWGHRVLLGRAALIRSCL